MQVDDNGVVKQAVVGQELVNRDGSYLKHFSLDGERRRAKAKRSTLEIELEPKKIMIFTGMM